MKKSLFQRVRDVVLADFHQMLDEKEKQNPLALLNQYLRDSEREVKKVEKLIERHQTLKADFYRELEQAHYLASKRKRQAHIAREANETALEARALEEAQYYEEQTSKLQDLYTRTTEQVEELERKIHDMKNKLKEMHTKRMELMARENLAHVNRRINDTIHKVSIGNPFLQFEKMEQYIGDLEIRINEEFERDTFDLRIAKLEKHLKEKPAEKEKDVVL
ncbi:PspA/IM30 family protein [Bacillus sp. 165]|uniref:PspA/IM30 family protein n=1 Tax=Bacillus sp. 165 TaxID=1529117 RepID=UPI001ADD3236|nr:PspA/IM30 family protein [Bacillus sp. 165]MBO9128331.1 PspA/IM30 family protein [Bacillus sp. 165]